MVFIVGQQSKFVFCLKKADVIRTLRAFSHVFNICPDSFVPSLKSKEHSSPAGRITCAYVYTFVDFVNSFFFCDDPSAPLLLLFCRIRIVKPESV